MVINEETLLTTMLSKLIIDFFEDAEQSGQQPKENLHELLAGRIVRFLMLLSGKVNSPPVIH